MCWVHCRCLKTFQLVVSPCGTRNTILKVNRATLGWKLQVCDFCAEWKGAHPAPSLSILGNSFEFPSMVGCNAKALAHSPFTKTLGFPLIFLWTQGSTESALAHTSHCWPVKHAEGERKGAQWKPSEWDQFLAKNPSPPSPLPSIFTSSPLCSLSLWLPSLPTLFHSL